MRRSSAPIKDLVGERFGRLVVESYSHQNKHHHSVWNCVCDCGNRTQVIRPNLVQGRTQSCGCYRREIEVVASKTHGMSGTRVYKIWVDMKKRCGNPRNKEFANYGGRGIKVCDEWARDFSTFYEWSMKNGYSDDMSIDRIDPNGDYCPQNCRWIPPSLQCRTRRPNPKYGVSGIHYDKKWDRYIVRIGVNGKRRFVGRFKTVEEAVAARMDAERRFWG